jgi:hypothetical protein
MRTATLVSLHCNPHCSSTAALQALRQSPLPLAAGEGMRVTGASRRSAAPAVSLLAPPSAAANFARGGEPGLFGRRNAVQPHRESCASAGTPPTLPLASRTSPFKSRSAGAPVARHRFPTRNRAAVCAMLCSRRVRKCAPSTVDPLFKSVQCQRSRPRRLTLRST